MSNRNIFCHAEIRVGISKNILYFIHRPSGRPVLGSGGKFRADEFIETVS